MLLPHLSLNNSLCIKQFLLKKERKLLKQNKDLLEVFKYSRRQQQKLQSFRKVSMKWHLSLKKHRKNLTLLWQLYQKRKQKQILKELKLQQKRKRLVFKKKKHQFLRKKLKLNLMMPCLCQKRQLECLKNLKKMICMFSIHLIHQLQMQLRLWNLVAICFRINQQKQTLENIQMTHTAFSICLNKTYSVIQTTLSRA